MTMNWFDWYDAALNVSVKELRILCRVVLALPDGAPQCRTFQRQHFVGAVYSEPGASYSSRMASSGSTRVARSAGNSIARTEMTIRPSNMLQNTKGSVVLIS